MAATRYKLNPGEHYKRLVGSIVSVTPSFADIRIEEITEQIVWVERTQVLRFKHARALEFRETLELIPR